MRKRCKSSHLATSIEFTIYLASLYHYITIIYSKWDSKWSVRYLQLRGTKKETILYNFHFLTVFLFTQLIYTNMDKRISMFLHGSALLDHYKNLNEKYTKSCTYITKRMLQMPGQDLDVWKERNKVSPFVQSSFVGQKKLTCGLGNLCLPN